MNLDILNGLALLYPNTIIHQLKKTLEHFPHSEVVMQDALSLGQIKSKHWLIDNLPDNLGTIFICGGWYGTLAAMMFSEVPEKFVKIRSFDIDPSCATIAESMNKPWTKDNWKFKASTLDILEMNFPTTHSTYRANGTSLQLTEMPDTVINTSCEHIKDFDSWYSKIPNGTLVVLQSNDYYELAEHINCSKSLEDFSDFVPMSVTLYEGELELEKYTRFMKIGIK